MTRRIGLLLAMGLAASAGAHGETVYKCVAGGQTVYQQSPCARGQRQETIRLQDSTPANGQVAPMPGPPTPRGDDTAEAPPPPAAPIPRMFGCVRATNGETYTSENGHPEPYMAPYGILGAGGVPLADVYSSQGSARSSAPELNRGHDVGASIATSNYVWVQDQCRELSPSETCHALQDDADANRKAIRNAFKSERAPLEARDAQLRAQLRGCG